MSTKEQIARENVTDMKRALLRGREVHAFVLGYWKVVCCVESKPDAEGNPRAMVKVKGDDKWYKLFEWEIV